MPRIVRTAAAEADLWEILLYIARDNEEAAFRFIDVIDEKLQMLARFPGAAKCVRSCSRACAASPCVIT